jgi:probable rRNA maturation factor
MDISILIEDGIEADIDTIWLQQIIEKVLNSEKTPANAEISLVITGQERIQELNREYRGKDNPTDVLSFSMQQIAPISGLSPVFVMPEPPDGMLHLGEVIVSYPQAEIQAKEQGHNVQKELANLVIHGVLHILGYDHEEPDMEVKMKSREAEILSSMDKEPL